MDDVIAIAGLIGALAVVPACADSIRPEAELDGGASSGDGPLPTGPVATVRNSDGSYTTYLDATSEELWRQVDLETGLATDAGWDLAGQRFHLKLNGGVSGAGGVEVAIVAQAFDAVTAVPSAGFITDLEDGDDANLDPDYAFEQGDGWYDYNPQTHVLTPKPITWVIRTDEDNVIKLAIERYYDTAGTAAHFTLHWAPLGGGA